MNTKQLTKEQAFEAIRKGEFGRDVTSSNHKVAIIMTQDWCSEWKAMKQWIDAMEEHRDIDIYELIYNRVDYFEDFLKLKEKSWTNNLIPYVRYYSEGVLIHESNYVTREVFFRFLH